MLGRVSEDQRSVLLLEDTRGVHQRAEAGRVDEREMRAVKNQIAGSLAQELVDVDSQLRDVASVDLAHEELHRGDIHGGRLCIHVGPLSIGPLTVPMIVHSYASTVLPVELVLFG